MGVWSWLVWRAASELAVPPSSCTTLSTEATLSDSPPHTRPQSTATRTEWSSRRVAEDEVCLLQLRARRPSISYVATDDTDFNLPCDCEYRSNDPSADAVVWNVRFLSQELPAAPRPGQAWLLTTRFESPSTMQFYPQTSAELARAFDRVSAHAAGDVGYQHDAAYRAPWFELEPRGASEPVDLSRRTKLALWYTSSCQYGPDTPSRRLDYLARLRAYLPTGAVSIYGSCHKSCPKGSECERAADSTHKFYLAFENSRCDGYVTEKFLRGYALGMVPVALGGMSRKDYERLVPAGSFLHVDDFASPAALAKELLRLSADEGAYRKLLAWRQRLAPPKFYADPTKLTRPAPWLFERALCGVCADLHSRSLNHSGTEKLRKWWKGSCRDGGATALVQWRANLRSAESAHAVAGMVVGAIAVIPAGYWLCRGHAGELGSRSWGPAWLLSTLAMNVANKRAVGREPVGIAAVQMAFAVLAMLLCWPALGLQSWADVRALLPWLPVGLLFAVMLASSLFGFERETLATIIVFASLRPLAAHAVELALFRERLNSGQLAGCATITVGSALYFHAPSRADGLNAVTVVGAIALVGNGLVATVDRVYQRYQLFHRAIPSTRAALVLVMNGSALVLTLPAVWFERERLAARAASWLGGEIADLGWVLASCAAGVAIGFAGIGFQKVVPASTFLVSSAASKVALLALEQLFFQTATFEDNLYAVAAMGIVVAGSLVHARAGITKEA